MENARLFIFETYCRIHQCIDIAMLAEKLNMDQEAAERWIVNLIRNAKLDAKIDSAAGHVIMGTQYPSIYQQVIEKTKGLPFRTYYISNQLEKRAQQSTKYSSVSCLLPLSFSSFSFFASTLFFATLTLLFLSSSSSSTSSSSARSHLPASLGNS
jgi:hypothetical protein